MKYRVALNQNDDANVAGAWRITDESGSNTFVEHVVFRCSTWTTQEPVGTKFKGWIETDGNLTLTGNRAVFDSISDATSQKAEPKDGGKSPILTATPSKRKR